MRAATTRAAAGALALALLSTAAAFAAPAGRTSLVPAAQLPCANSVITTPAQDEIVSGQVPVFGSASIDPFNFYKVEYAASYAPESWSAMSTTISQPVVNGLLDVWDTTRVPDGSYNLKLTVVNQAGEEVCRATVSGLIVANDATPTASPTVTPEESPTPEPTLAPEEPTHTPTAEPTVAPILPTDAEDEPFSAVSVRGIVAAFARGFMAALLVSLTVLIIFAVRR